jgi:hypothetical protein
MRSTICLSVNKNYHLFTRAWIIPEEHSWCTPPGWL